MLSVCVLVQLASCARLSVPAADSAGAVQANLDNTTTVTTTTKKLPLPRTTTRKKPKASTTRTTATSSTDTTVTLTTKTSTTIRRSTKTTTTRTDTTSTLTTTTPQHITSQYTFVGASECVGLGAVTAAVSNGTICPMEPAVQNKTWVNVGNGWCREVFKVSTRTAWELF